MPASGTSVGPGDQAALGSRALGKVLHVRAEHGRAARGRSQDVGPAPAADRHCAALRDRGGARSSRRRHGVAARLNAIGPITGFRWVQRTRTAVPARVAPARLGVLSDAVLRLRAAFEIPEVDRDAPVRWAALRTQTGLRLPDAIVLDTALSHRARAVVTFDAKLATAATDHGLEIAST
ncbi:MAG: type II toxin-antitoxin system VapC family toxin [Acidimicrobiales bacterium]|nr:type II toxin-antitoxin system VapC family toxin [Acidimicrobiales bacterium]MYI28492.1 type II toxin-antitoxin system VapC family toxin [Acidimicrobiales bacterium]